MTTEQATSRTWMEWAVRYGDAVTEPCTSRATAEAEVRDAVRMRVDMTTAKVAVCTRCWLSAEEVPPAPNNWTAAALATVTFEDGVLHVAPHKPDCRELARHCDAYPRAEL